MINDYNYRQIDMIVVGKEGLVETIGRYTDLGYAIGVKPRTHKSVEGFYSTEYMVVIYKEEVETNE